MRRSILLFIASSAILFSHHANARVAAGDLINTKAIDHPWVVAPGTRLAAGDPSQNEFYILGREERPRTDPTKIAVAINETLHAISKKALQTKKHHIAHHKTKANFKIKVASKHRFAKKTVIDG